MRKPDIRTHYINDGERISVQWWDSPSAPPCKVDQVYAIAVSLDSALCFVVRYGNGDAANLPGGKSEPSESVEDTLKRELREETNNEVLWWRHLGFQRLTSEKGLDTVQARVVAVVRSLGSFVYDPGGHVIGFDLVPLHELNDCIGYGSVGERMVTLARTALDAQAAGRRPERGDSERAA